MTVSIRHFLNSDSVVCMLCPLPTLLAAAAIVRMVAISGSYGVKRAGCPLDLRARASMYKQSSALENA